MKINNIAIIGGGTAGWLAANHLAVKLQNRADVSITLIESPDIPPIGVGEGTVPAIRRSLASFGIKEADLITKCETTFKQSIKFVNWLDKSKHGELNSYHHLFDHPKKYADLVDYWLNQSQQQNQTGFAEFCSPQYSACENNRAPKLDTSKEYEGITGYAYHFNAAKFAALLADNAKSKFAVEHVIANVTQVNKTSSDQIKSLVLNGEEEREFDFYIDCSGFKSLLINDTLHVPFVDKSDTLLVDSAITVQVPTEADSEIPPYTLATAHQAGWIWDIALTGRRGVGFVYSSKYMTEDQARAKLKHYVGESFDKLATRKIPMKIGYRASMWQGNCVALGLAQGFVEPLEATSILLTDFTAGYLAQRFPTDSSEVAMLSHRYNKTVTYCWERVINFIKLHYCLSDRQDSQFWLDNQAQEGIAQSLQEQLSWWRNSAPIAEDFFSKFEIFDLDNYLYVLYGMKFTTQTPNLTAAQLAVAQKDAELMAHYGKEMANKLPSHRSLINQYLTTQ